LEVGSFSEFHYKDEDISAYNHRVELSQEVYLCKWKEANVQSGNPKPLYICSANTTISQQVAQAESENRASAAKADTVRRTSAAKKSLHIARRNVRRKRNLKRNLTLAQVP
jgi:hypothetical protein